MELAEQTPKPATSKTSIEKIVTKITTEALASDKKNPKPEVKKVPSDKESDKEKEIALEQEEIALERAKAIQHEHTNLLEVQHALDEQYIFATGITEGIAKSLQEVYEKRTTANGSVNGQHVFSSKMNEYLKGILASSLKKLGEDQKKLKDSLKDDAGASKAYLLKSNLKRFAIISLMTTTASEAKKSAERKRSRDASMLQLFDYAFGASKSEFMSTKDSRRYTLLENLMLLTFADELKAVDLAAFYKTCSGLETDQAAPVEKPEDKKEEGDDKEGHEEGVNTEAMDAKKTAVPPTPLRTLYEEAGVGQKGDR